MGFCQNNNVLNFEFEFVGKSSLSLSLCLAQAMATTASVLIPLDVPGTKEEDKRAKPAITAGEKERQRQMHACMQQLCVCKS
jgi:hypothetical protein